MTNLKKLCAFTLSELLLSLTIVGIIAVLTVPVIVSNVQKKLFATQVKNFVAEIEQLAQDELIAHRTRDLSNTDFADPEKLLSDKHFSIVKSCSASTAAKDCWKTTATGKDKVKYKKLNKSTLSSFQSGYTVILKNGITSGFRYVSGYPRFIIDINGTDKPNIVGRDLFAFYLTSNGKAVDYSYIMSLNSSLSQKINQCKTDDTQGPKSCFGALVDSGWKMDY